MSRILSTTKRVEGFRKPGVGSIIDRQIPAGNSILACWLMNEGAGDIVKDLGRRQYIGTLTNGPTWVVSSPGPALSFVTNDYVLFGDVLGWLKTTPQTLVARVMFRDLAGERTIISKSNIAGPYDGLTWDVSLSKLRYALIKSHPSDAILLSSDTVLSTNIAYVLVVTYDGSGVADGVTFYIDGVKTAKTISTDTLVSDPVNTKPFEIGARDGSSNPLDGIIDYVVVCDRALSAGEVMQVYLRPFHFIWQPRVFYPPRAVAAAETVLSAPIWYGA